MVLQEAMPMNTYCLLFVLPAQHYKVQISASKYTSQQSIMKGFSRISPPFLWIWKNPKSQLSKQVLLLQKQQSLFFKSLTYQILIILKSPLILFHENMNLFYSLVELTSRKTNRCLCLCTPNLCGSQIILSNLLRNNVAFSFPST